MIPSLKTSRNALIHYTRACQILEGCRGFADNIIHMCICLHTHVHVCMKEGSCFSLLTQSEK